MLTDRRRLHGVNRVMIILALCAVACAGGRDGPTRIGSSLGERHLEPAHAEDEPPDPEEGVPEDVVERAALPFYAVRLSDKQPLPPEAFHAELLRAQAVCLAEQHDNPHDHYAEFVTLTELAKRAPMRGREIGVGMEAFEHRFQDKIDRFLNGRSDEDELLERTEYYERWGFSFSYYRPTIEAAQDHGLSIVALNAQSELVRAVAKKGLQALSESDQQKIGGVELNDAEHRALFDRAMADHPHNSSSPERLYQAQVIRDESMAEVAASWLSRRHPARLLLILAGSAHCHDSAIPARIRRRLSSHVVSVKPIIKHANQPLPEAELRGYGYAFVMTPDS